MKVSIIIPNWNGSALLQKYLPKVIATSDGAEIIVVDDASIDDSLAVLQNKFPTVAVIAKEAHEGFASTVNRGVAASDADIVVLLNTDVAPEKGFLKPLISHFTDPSVFAVGCMDKSTEDGKIILRGRGLAGWKKGFFVHSRGEIDAHDTAWVSGGSGAFRKTIWKKLGGMDPIYNPFYWEDIDLSYRARKSGYRLVFEPKSVVQHFHEEGKIKRDYSSGWIKQIAYRNQFIFIWKNLSDIKVVSEHCFWAPIRLLQAVIRGDIAFILGYIRAILLLPAIIHSRIQSSATWKKQDGELTSSPI